MIDVNEEVLSDDEGKPLSGQNMIDIEDIDDDIGEEEEDEEPYRDPPMGFIRLRPSRFNYIPGTIFIEYPPELGIVRSDVSKLEKLGKKKLLYSCYWGRNCIKNAFRRAGFENTESSSWTAMWSKHQTAEVIGSMNCLQKVNHFPSSWCIGRKDRLQRTISAMTRLHGDEFGFHPDGFSLPKDGGNLERCLRNDSASSRASKKGGNLWIVKPLASSCGRGIRVITAEKALAYAKSNKKMLVQRYLADPYLINRNKFDLRIYVLVAGVDPLRIYIHEEGLTRISTHAYSLKNIKDRFAHLTNYSINKKSALFAPAKEAETSGRSPRKVDSSAEDGPSLECEVEAEGQSAGEAGGSTETEGFKWSLKAFRKWLEAREGVEISNKTFQAIDDVVVKTIIAAEPELSHSLHTVANYRTNCFELFGFDIFLDKQLRPHLVEVNISPSLMGSSPLDKRIKGTLVADACHVVGFHAHDPALLAKYSRLESKGSAAPGTKSSKYKSYGASEASSREPPHKKTKDEVNPFSFSSLSKMMGQQDLWRRDPCPASIDLATLGNGDSSWLMLLMVEDEFERAASSKFKRIHPVPQTVEKYLSFCKNPRFSDHLLGLWTMRGLSHNSSNRQYIPERFLKKSSQPTSEVEGAGTPRSGRRPTSATSRHSSASSRRARKQVVEVATSSRTPTATVSNDDRSSAKSESCCRNGVELSAVFQGSLGNDVHENMRGHRSTHTSVSSTRQRKDVDGNDDRCTPRSSAMEILSGVSESNNNPVDLCGRLGLSREHRKAVADRKGGAVSHSSSPIRRISEASTNRPQSGQRSRVVTHAQRMMAERRTRGSSMGREVTISRGKSREGAARRPSSGNTSKTNTAAAKESSRAVREAQEIYTDAKQKYRPIGKHGRLRDQVQQSRLNMTSGFVLATENEDMTTIDPQQGREATPQGSRRTTSHLIHRRVSHSPVVVMSKLLLNESNGEEADLSNRVSGASSTGGWGSAGRMVPYRPRSANSAQRGMAHSKNV